MTRPYGPRECLEVTGRRRGRLEVVLDLMEDCSDKPGLPITRLHSLTNLCYTSVKEILDYLIAQDLIRVTTLPYSYIGNGRVTDYYMITEQARPLIESWKTIKKYFKLS